MPISPRGKRGIHGIDHNVPQVDRFGGKARLSGIDFARLQQTLDSRCAAAATRSLSMAAVCCARQGLPFPERGNVPYATLPIQRQSNRR
ncbi:MAG: hypothetical protein JOZ81_19070 [Chloroflexi bacterium]|nr:hypothetical protein [Chloroflexota bacterium]